MPETKKESKITYSPLSLDKASYSTLIIGIFKGKNLDDSAKKANERAGNAISDCLKSGDFKAEYGETRNLFINKGSLKYILLAGLGEEKEYKLEKLNSLIAEISKRLRDSNIGKFGVLLPSFASSGYDEAQIAENVAISAALGLHQFIDFRTKELDKIKNADEVFLLSDKNHDAAISQSRIISNSIVKSRDLANTPPNIANPEYFANYAKELAKKSGLKCAILNKHDIEKLKMGCFLAVAQGSKNEPRLVVLEYNGAGKSDKPVVLVGKGITFDSGGLNIKPYPGMTTMKGDKTGAVIAIHTIEACALLRWPIKIVSIIP